MFSKTSRYNSCNTYVALDAAGRSVRVTAPREMQSVDARFEHIVMEADRLDSLGQKYYRKPKKWWQICDANPEFIFPDDLLHDTAVKTVRFSAETMLFDAGESIATLLSELRSVPGIEAADAMFDERFYSIDENIEPTDVLPFNCIQIIYNHATIDLQWLIARLNAKIVNPKAPVSINRTGKKIALPPDQIMGKR